MCDIRRNSVFCSLVSCSDGRNMLLNDKTVVYFLLEMIVSHSLMVELCESSK